MENPPSHSSYRQRRFRSSRSRQWSNGLKSLSLLLFGAGLGVISYDWMTSSASSSPNALRAGISPVLQSFSNLIASADPTQRATQTNTDVASATICVQASMPNGKKVCASGVSIDPRLAGVDPKQGSVVLTNYHVIFDANGRPNLQLNGKGQVFEAEVIKQSSDFDLALLLVPKVQFPAATLAESSPEQGVAVRAIGFPNNQPLTVKDSRLLGETQNCLAVPPCLAIQQGTITHGNSGGPLEANGQVIGITEGEIEDEIAIPVEQVRQFLLGQAPSAPSNSPANGFPSNGSPSNGPPSNGYPSNGYPPQFEPGRRRRAPNFYPPMRTPHEFPPMYEAPPYAW